MVRTESDTTTRLRYVVAVIAIVIGGGAVLGIGCDRGSTSPPEKAEGPPQTPASESGASIVEPARETPRTPPCEVNGKEPCVLRLGGRGAPSVSASCLVEPWSRYVTFTLPNRFADVNGDGWSEAVLRIALDPVRECGGAKIKVHYEDPVRGFSLDIGDSPTNNGLGGDEGSTRSCAELQVQEGYLQIESALIEPRSEMEHDRFEIAPMAGREIEFEIRDESLSIDLPSPRDVGGRIRWTRETPRTRLLFALTDPSEGAPKIGVAPNDHAIYAAFNRVIHRLDGAPSKARFGSGVSRVEISLTP